MIYGQDMTRQGSTNFYNKSVNMNTHLPFTDGHNYISGLSTRIRGGDLVVEDKNICIGSTCLTEDDLKNLKTIGNTYVRRNELKYITGAGSYNGTVVRADNCRGTTTNNSSTSCTNGSWTKYGNASF
jgi:hypothetical protein